MAAFWAKASAETESRCGQILLNHPDAAAKCLVWATSSNPVLLTAANTQFIGQSHQHRDCRTDRQTNHQQRGK